MFDVNPTGIGQQNLQRIRKTNNQQISSNNYQQRQQQQTDLIRTYREFEANGAAFSIIQFVRIIVALSISVVQLFFKRIFRQQKNIFDLELKQNNNNNNKTTLNKHSTTTSSLLDASFALHPIKTLNYFLSKNYRLIEKTIFNSDVFYNLYYTLCNFTMLDRLRRFCRWCPTSVEELENAEQRILERKFVMFFCRI